MASALTPLANAVAYVHGLTAKAHAVAYVRGLTAKLYAASGDDKSMRDEARACGIAVPSGSSYSSSSFTYIVAVSAADGELAALLGVNKFNGELYLEFESFTGWDDTEEITHFVKMKLTIDIDPALMAAAIAVLPRGIGTITLEDEDFEKLEMDQWKTLCTDVLDTHGSKTITL